MKNQAFKAPLKSYLYEPKAVTCLQLIGDHKDILVSGINFGDSIYMWDTVTLQMIGKIRANACIINVYLNSIG